MRVVLQRVSKARVIIDDREHGRIGPGFVLLVGFEADDDVKDLNWICRKVVSMRIFPDEQGKMNLDLHEVGGELMVISQFTLHASTRKGNRPSFMKAARPDQAIPLYQGFLDILQAASEGRVVSGIFGAEMHVELVNSGPVTILIDSKNRE